MANDNDGRWLIDKRITLGNIFTILALSLTFIAAYFQFSYRVTTLEANQRDLQVTLTQLTDLVKEQNFTMKTIQESLQLAPLHVHVGNRIIYLGRPPVVTDEHGNVINPSGTGDK
jgi:hypothetical protein